MQEGGDDDETGKERKADNVLFIDIIRVNISEDLLFLSSLITSLTRCFIKYTFFYKNGSAINRNMEIRTCSSISV